MRILSRFFKCFFINIKTTISVKIVALEINFKMKKKNDEAGLFQKLCSCAYSPRINNGNNFTNAYPYVCMCSYVYYLSVSYLLEVMEVNIQTYIYTYIHIFLHLSIFCTYTCV